MRRSLGIWLVVAFCTLNAVGALFGFYIIVSGKMPQTTLRQDNFFASLGVFDYLLSVLLHVFIAAGGICLFMFRKIALSLFIAAAAVKLLTDIWQAVTHRFLAGASGPQEIVLASFVISWGIFVAIIAYTDLLSRRGILH